ncbi:MAG: PASTA domain-containing protein [Treponema sp.]|jgi:beta-lactam-binding protein with PASTA domain|nr:PASTA domain-containing protein [Treponema sp.]
MGIDLSSIEEYVTNHLKMFVLSLMALVLIVILIAGTVFFIAVRGEEQTMVPNVVGKELTQALLELQVKELYPRLQLRYSQVSTDKGFILEQDPRPGTIVKAGRRIRLVVSQGVVLNKIENFVTRNIDEVKMEIATINAAVTGIPLLTIKEPMMYEFSNEAPGTILEQKPEPGTDISGPTILEFVVSKGRENLTVIVPQLQGLGLDAALRAIYASGINFQFNIRDRQENETGETVVSQSLDVNAVIPLNAVVHLTFTPAQSLAADEVFGLFSYTMPPNPYPIMVHLEALLPSGERRMLFSVNYMGGIFTVPYKLPAETELVLSMLNRELYREKIGE